MSEVATDAFAAESGAIPVVVSNTTNTFNPSSDSAKISNLQYTSSTDTTSKFYTEEDLARVRSQEKDKLYPQIDALKEELAALKREREEKAAKKAAIEAEAEAKRLEEEKKQQEEELSLRDLLTKKEQDWQDQLNAEKAERERAFALLEREKTFAELQQYRQMRVEQMREEIIPELIDLIQGNTPEEIDASIAGLQERSSRILESAQQAMQATRRDIQGTRVTTPPAGPLDINTGNRQFTAEDISSMSMNDYAKLRGQLLSDKAQGRSQGLFG